VLGTLKELETELRELLPAYSFPRPDKFSSEGVGALEERLRTAGAEFYGEAARRSGATQAAINELIQRTQQLHEVVARLHYLISHYRTPDDPVGRITGMRDDAQAIQAEARLAAAAMTKLLEQVKPVMDVLNRKNDTTGLRKREVRIRLEDAG
jgi:hypothetical protein